MSLCVCVCVCVSRSQDCVSLPGGGCLCQCVCPSVFGCLCVCVSPCFAALVGRFFTMRTTSNMDSETGKARWLAKETQKKCPIKVTHSTVRVPVSLSEAAYGSIHTYSFSSNEHFTCFTTHLYMEVHFYRVVGQGLVTGHGSCG